MESASYCVLDSSRKKTCMGNTIAPNYNVEEKPTGSCGPNGIWKIFAATNKASGAEASVLVFNKAQFDELKVPKDDREKILDVLRREIKALSVLRHPNIVKVVELIEENKKILAVVTERIQCSLANLVGDTTGFKADDVPEVMKEYTLSQFEITCGLMYLSEGLSFLHRTAKRTHLDLTPRSIYVTPGGIWKLGGFGFSQPFNVGEVLTCPFFAAASTSQAVRQTAYATTPNLNYASPELTKEPFQFTSNTDMFSFALIALECFKLESEGGKTTPVLDIKDGNPRTHAYQMERFRPDFKLVPPTVTVELRSMLNSLPTHRLDAQGMVESSYFSSGPVNTLKSIDTLLDQEPARQAQVLKELTHQLKPFPPRLLKDMVLPPLERLSASPLLAPFVLPSVFYIADVLDKVTFEKYIIRIIVPLMTMKTPPDRAAQCLLITAQHSDVILKQGSSEFILNQFMPMISRGMECGVTEIVETILKQIPAIAAKADMSLLKNVLLPSVSKAIIATTQLSVRVNGLVCISKIFHYFDKQTVIDIVLATLRQALANDRSPAVCMCVLGCYDAIAKFLGPEHTARLILPKVTYLLWEQTLNSRQFDTFAEKTLGMINMVIEARRNGFTDDDRREASAEAAVSEGKVIMGTRTLSMDEAEAQFKAIKKDKAPEESESYAPYSDARSAPAVPSGVASPGWSWDMDDLTSIDFKSSKPTNSLLSDSNLFASLTIPPAATPPPTWPSESTPPPSLAGWGSTGPVAAVDSRRSTSMASVARPGLAETPSSMSMPLARPIDSKPIEDWPRAAPVASVVKASDRPSARKLPSAAPDPFADFGTVSLKPPTSAAAADPFASFGTVSVPGAVPPKGYTPPLPGLAPAGTRKPSSVSKPVPGAGMSDDDFFGAMLGKR